MTKNELVTTLEQFCLIEKAVVLYSGHIKNTLVFSGLKHDVLSQVREVLEALEKEGHQSDASLEKLINIIREKDQNVY